MESFKLAELANIGLPVECTEAGDGRPSERDKRSISGEGCEASDRCDAGEGCKGVELCEGGEGGEGGEAFTNDDTSLSTKVWPLPW